MLLVWCFGIITVVRLVCVCVSACVRACVRACVCVFMLYALN